MNTDGMYEATMVLVRNLREYPAEWHDYVKAFLSRIMAQFLNDGISRDDKDCNEYACNCLEAMQDCNIKPSIDSLISDLEYFSDRWSWERVMWIMELSRIVRDSEE